MKHLPLDQHDMEWLSEQFNELYKHMDGVVASIDLNEGKCRAEVDARIAVVEDKASKAAATAAALSVEVDWHKWYIRTVTGAVIGSIVGLFVLVLKVFSVKL